MSSSVYSDPFSLSSPSRKLIICVRIFGIIPQLLNAVSWFIALFNIAMMMMMMSPHVSVSVNHFSCSVFKFTDSFLSCMEFRMSLSQGSFTFDILFLASPFDFLLEILFILRLLMHAVYLFQTVF